MPSWESHVRRGKKRRLVAPVKEFGCQQTRHPQELSTAQILASVCTKDAKGHLIRSLHVTADSAQSFA